MACLPKDTLKPGQQWTCQDYAGVSTPTWAVLMKDFCPTEAILADVKTKACEVVKSASGDVHGNIQDPNMYKYAVCSIAQKVCGGFDSDACKDKPEILSNADLNLAAATAIWQIDCRDPNPGGGALSLGKGALIILVIGFAFILVLKR